MIQIKKPRDKFCSQCASELIVYDEVFGFYKCLKCDHHWGYDIDDPDCEELSDDKDLN